METSVCENVPEHSHAIDALRDDYTLTQQRDSCPVQTLSQEEVRDDQNDLQCDATPNPSHHYHMDLPELRSERADDEEYTELSETLCPCTDTSVGDYILFCLGLGLRHSWTWEAQVDFLKVPNTIYGKNKLNATKYSYLKYLDENKSDISYHIYCSECDFYIGKKDNLKGCVPCEHCYSEINVSEAKNYFISLSLESQMKNLLKDPKIATMILNHRFNREKTQPNAYEDIFDGAEYVKHTVKEGILASPFSFSYTFFTDGVPLGRSSSQTIWPIYVTINELPEKERKKNVLAGLYVGPRDPCQNVFLHPFVMEANKLSEDGFEWCYEGKRIVSRFIPLCAVVDSVAKFQVQNMQSFHATQGCTFCYQKQVRTRRGRRFTVSTSEPELRSIESTKRDLMEAFEKRDEVNEGDRHCRGVKGPSALMQLLYFSFISGFVVDYMHAILLGVIRLHTELILESIRKKFWIGMEEDRLGMEHLISVINKRLLKIKPPSCISRIPRTIKDFKIWKASEWRSWLLFYCVPCLSGLLKDKHIIHIAMLSKATNLLLQKSVTLQEVEEAHRLFLCYSFFFQKYFGEEFVTYNIHLLSHVCTGVKNWGPLWTHNAFVFEGQNRYLLQLCKSPMYVVEQIARKYLLYNSMPFLTVKLSKAESTLEFCEDILGKKLKRYDRCKEILLLGKGERITLPDDEQESLIKYCDQT